MPSLPFWVQLSAEQETTELLYQLYGLVIATDNLFPGETSIANREVGVQVRSITPLPLLSPSNWFINWTFPGGKVALVCQTEDGYLLRFNELADFSIDKKGNEMLCIPKPGIPEDTIQHLLFRSGHSISH